MVSDGATVRRKRLTAELAGQVVFGDNDARGDASFVFKAVYGTPGQPVRLHDSSELFTLFTKALGVTDPSERVGTLNSLYKRLREEQYHLGIGYVNIPWAVGPRVANWQPWPLSNYPSNLHGITLK